MVTGVGITKFLLSTIFLARVRYSSACAAVGSYYSITVMRRISACWTML